MTDFKYDIAFSFLAGDESLAYEINDLIQDRFKTFIYSKAQEELAGSDGEAKFNDVFAKQSRFVVILYRENWGTTPWTRIEQTAIRNRAFDEGWDFTIFVMLDNAKAPGWIPKTQLYYDYSRWGSKGVAPVIERKAEELGANPHEETLEEKRTRIARKAKAEQERKYYLSSQQAMIDLQDEAPLLLSTVEKYHNSIKDQVNNMFTGVDRNFNYYYRINQDHLSILFRINNNNEYELRRKYLTIFIYSWHGHREFQDYEENILHEANYIFDKNLQGQKGWSDYKTNEGFMQTDPLVKYWIHKYLDIINAG